MATTTAIATENVKKEIGLLSKTTTLRVNQKFFTFLCCRSLHDFDVKMPPKFRVLWRTLTSDDAFFVP